MNKIKLFYGGHADVETRINQWLEENKHITIIEISHRSNSGVSIMVRYKE